VRPVVDPQGMEEGRVLRRDERRRIREEEGMKRAEESRVGLSFKVFGFWVIESSYISSLLTMVVELVLFQVAKRSLKRSRLNPNKANLFCIRSFGGIQTMMAMVITIVHVLLLGQFYF